MGLEAMFTKLCYSPVKYDPLLNHCIKLIQMIFSKVTLFGYIPFSEGFYRHVLTNMEVVTLQRNHLFWVLHFEQSHVQ